MGWNLVNIEVLDALGKDSQKCPPDTQKIHLYLMLEVCSLVTAMPKQLRAHVLRTFTNGPHETLANLTKFRLASTPRLIAHRGVKVSHNSFTYPPELSVID